MYDAIIILSIWQKVNGMFNKLREATDLHMIMTGENTVASPEPDPVSESR